MTATLCVFSEHIVFVCCIALVYNGTTIVSQLVCSGRNSPIMKRIGVRELKARMSEALHDVQTGETIEVTNHGELVALLVPVRSADEARAQAWATLRSLDALRAEIAQHLSEPIDVTQIISDMRR